MYTLEKRQELSNTMQTFVKTSGLSANAFAIERLGFKSGSKLSHVLNGWDKEGLVGVATWQTIEKYIENQQGYKVIATANLIKIWETCERAYALKQACAIVGEGGFGKTTAFEKFKEKIESEKAYTIFYFDASKTKTRKQFITGLLNSVGCNKIGTIAKQLDELQKHMRNKKALLIVDEVSSLKGDFVTIIKDIITVLKGLCGLVFAGTPYFLNNLNKGANKDKHLYSETRDRLFMLPEHLAAPTESEAKAIFTANNITGEALNIVLGKVENMQKYSIVGKNTFRGIKDCIDMIKYIQETKTKEPTLKTLQIL